MAKLVICKSCGKEIAKNAKSCPHCGAPAKRHTALGIVLFVFGVMIFLAGFGSALGGEQPQKVGQSSDLPAVQTTEAAPTVFNVGDVVELRDIRVTLVSVKESTGANFFAPKDGEVFLICEFDIENNSERDIAVSSLMCFEAYVDGYTCTMDLSAILASGMDQLDGTVAAGKKMHGAIGYSAKKDYKELEVRFTPDFWAGSDIVFVYNK